VGKTLASFDFEVVPMVSKAQVMALTAGDSWLEKGANLLLFGPPGAGKSHLAAATGFALIENGWRVLFMRTSDLVQRLQIARRELALESMLAKLDKYHLLILDDIAYVSKDQAETSVLFELIGTRYERRSKFREGKPEPIVGTFSQETLAEMIGTTRSRVSFFMNRFRKLGFIECNGKLEVHNSSLNVVLHDNSQIRRDARTST
jgi:energy-coupling factor transporter ATP-binding protein EcfA2